MSQPSNLDLLTSRRQLFVGAAGVVAATVLVAGSGGLISPATAQTTTVPAPAAPHAASAGLDWKGMESLSLGDAPLAAGKLGGLALLDVTALPLLKNVSLNVQRLAPGAAREPHWHNSSAEMDCVIEGTGEFGIIGLDGTLTRIAIEPGSVVFVPQGLTHYVANTGRTELVIAMGFNATRTSSSALSNSLKAFGSDRLAQTTGLSAADLTMPSDTESQIYTGFGTLPPLDPAAATLVDGGVTSANFAAISGFANQYGTAKDVDARTIPGLDRVSLSFMTLEPGAMRDAHWHPQGTELIYIESGELEWGLQAPGKSGESSVFTAKQGQAVAIPQGWLHYAANTGTQTARLIVLWESTAPKSIELAGMLSVLPTELTLASAGPIMNEATARSLLGKQPRLISPAG
jgi:oxalate decarboxylase